MLFLAKRHTSKVLCKRLEYLLLIFVSAFFFVFRVVNLVDLTPIVSNLGFWCESFLIDTYCVDLGFFGSTFSLIAFFFVKFFAIASFLLLQDLSSSMLVIIYGLFVKFVSRFKSFKSKTVWFRLTLIKNETICSD